MIVTTKSKRMRSLINFLMEKEAEEAEEHQFGHGIPYPNQPNAGNSLPKVAIYNKELLPAFSNM